MFTALMVKQIRGENATWANNGLVYLSRDLHDSLEESLQGRTFYCKSVKEFETLCLQLSVASNL